MIRKKTWPGWLVKGVSEGVGSIEFGNVQYSEPAGAGIRRISRVKHDESFERVVYFLREISSLISY